MLRIGTVFLAAVLLATRIGADDAPLVNAVKFAADLYTAVRSENPTENLIVSPLSVQTALGILLLGATGNTKDQIVQGSHIRAKNVSAFADHFNGVLERNPRTGVLKMANKIYAQNGYSVNPALELFAAKQVANIDFSNPAEAARNINSWVEENTGNKIKNLFKDDDLDSRTRMVLVNALHFKAAWEDAFNEIYTKRAQFWISETESVDVDMMSKTTPIWYGNLPDLNATIGFIPYKDTPMHFMIILPNSRTGLDEVEKKLKSFDFSTLKQSIIDMWVDVHLPKFKIETSVDLKSVLSKLGMTDMFSYAAEFPDLLDTTERLMIDKAVHKAFISVDEKGTEAAAATGYSMRPLSIPPRLVVDRPFFFAITTPTDVAFVGSVRKF